LLANLLASTEKATPPPKKNTHTQRLSLTQITKRNLKLKSHL